MEKAGWLEFKINFVMSTTDIHGFEFLKNAHFTH